MLKLIVTPAKVTRVVFGGEWGGDSAMVSQSDIAIVIEKFVKPALGTLYPAIEQGRYVELVEEHLLLPIALYVKSQIIRDSALRSTLVGSVTFRGEEFTHADSAAIALAVKCARADAANLLRKAIAHIEDNADKYPEYDPRESILNQVSISGSIVM